MRSRPLVPDRNISSVCNWLKRHDQVISEDEVKYLTHRHDLMPLVPKLKSSLRHLLERSEGFRLSKFWKRAHSDVFDGLDNECGHDVHYSSDEKIDGFIAGIIMTLGVIMLISPLWVLEFIREPTIRLTIISTFIVLFLALLSFTTVAKPFESLAAGAAQVPPSLACL